MPFLRKKLVGSAICIAVMLSNGSASAVPACDDINLALASSGKFSEWRGKKTDDNVWNTTHEIFGFTQCEIVNRDFRCRRQTSGSLDLAKADYTATRGLVEACLPKSEWRHSPGTDSLPSQRFLHPDGRNGFVALIKLVDTYWLQLTIFERF